MATSQAAKPVEPKVQPLIGAVTRDGFVIIEIGPEFQQHHVHEALLTHHLEYFRNAFNGSWKESDDKRVSLNDVDPIAFDVFVQWLYTQRIPTYTEYRKMAVGKPSATADDDEWITALTKSLVFGDRFLVPVFCQDVNDFIVNRILGDDFCIAIPISPTFFTAAKYAFENLPEDHVLLKFLVDVHCRYWQVQTYEEEHVISEILSQQVPAALLVKIMVRYASRVTGGRDTWWDESLDRCVYYIDNDDEERRQNGNE